MTQDKLKRILHYNENTGVFTWIKCASTNMSTGDIAGSVSVKGYIKIKINNKTYLAHRLAWLYVYGDFPLGDIDHINHNGLDNRLSNIRIANGSTNMKNRTKNKNNTSGQCGVVWNKKSKLWQAQIGNKGKVIQLGLYAEFSDAVNARKNAEVLYGFHKNHGKDL